MLTVADLAPPIIDEHYPADKTRHEQLQFLAGYAAAAPELFGSRPWEISVRESTVEIRTVPDRRLRQADWDGRESTIATGAALYFLCLAMRCHHFEPVVETFPVSCEPTFVARVSVMAGATPTDEEKELFELLAGDLREVNMTPNLDAIASGLQGLQLASCEEGVSLRYLENEMLRTMTRSMMSPGDKLFYQRTEERAAFQAWLGAEPSGESPDPDFVTWTVRHDQVSWNGYRPEGPDDSMALGALCTAHEDERQWLAVGQALARMQLQAMASGMIIEVFNQPLHVPGLRARFARETGFCNFPQVVVRIGFANGASSNTLRDHALLSSKPCDCGCGGDCQGEKNESSSRD